MEKQRRSLHEASAPEHVPVTQCRQTLELCDTTLLRRKLWPQADLFRHGLRLRGCLWQQRPRCCENIKTISPVVIAW